MCDGANNMRYCPDCRRVVAVFNHHVSGDTVCTQCARVLDQRYVDESSEWRSFLNDVGGIDGSGHVHAGGAANRLLADAVQLNATTTAYPSPVSNVQSPEASDSDDTHGEEGACSVLPRMRGAVGAAGHPQGGAMPKMRGAVAAAAAHPRGGAMPKMRGAAPDKSLADAFHSIDDMAERLGLAEPIRERAREMYRKLEEAKAFPKGGKCRNRHALYAACLHVACRAAGTPRTFKELASVTGDSATAGIKDIGRLVKHIKDHLGEEGGAQAAGEMMMSTTVRAGDYLRRFGSLLGMGDQEVNAALEAARRLEKNLDVRRNPDSIAASVIYMAIQRAGADQSIRDVSTATGVSEVTIREVYYKDLRPHAELLFG
ncbi:transcription initiation factor IIB-like [Lolium rigidum]|uniref:transcription initiation factor IIB-like n=1 Tax=Lolium rigidum TaxID=89674 RepID=UPI001F5E0F9F|nr:transcription initiation factor IIB-like [Lolium rigidum]